MSLLSHTEQSLPPGGSSLSQLHSRRHPKEGFTLLHRQDSWHMATLDYSPMFPPHSSMLRRDQSGKTSLQEEAFFWDFQVVLRLLGRGDLSPLHNGRETATTLDDCLLGDSGQVLIYRRKGGWCQGGIRQEEDKIQLSSLRSAG